MQTLLYFFRRYCKELDSMNWKLMQEVFYDCLDFCEVYDRLPYFYMTGGAPILHPDFWKLLALMKQHKIPFTILGNPFHLNEEVCRELKGYGCEKYQLSIDGMSKPGSFDTTLAKIGCINRAGIRSVIMTTVSGMPVEECKTARWQIYLNLDWQMYGFARWSNIETTANLKNDANVNCWPFVEAVRRW